jgi:hypothetical protein
MSNEVGLRLKELRRKLNMTQPQLGEKIVSKAMGSGMLFYYLDSDGVDSDGIR